MEESKDGRIAWRLLSIPDSSFPSQNTSSHNLLVTQSLVFCVSVRFALFESTHIRNCSGMNQWPWNLVFKVDGETELYSYTPKSDVSWWKRGFPRLLVEIHSSGSTDNIRLFLQGAGIVRLANLESEGHDEKNANTFVLVVQYVDKNFRGYRYLFFQNEGEKVCRRRFFIPRALQNDTSRAGSA